MASLETSLQAERPHGTRTRYVAGRCRCEPCREANRAYARLRGKLQRDGDWNGVVPSLKARKHMLKLRKRGIGRRSVADITGVAESILSGIVTGKRKNIRARTERKVLAVTTAAMHDAKLVPALVTTTRISALIEEGLTRTEIARRLGSKSKAPALQLAKRSKVTARTQARVERLYREVTT